HDCLSASVGVHPNTSVTDEITVEALAAFAQEDKVVAIGETGLDYFRSEGDLEWQRERFRTHIRAAREINKPLIIHCREAKEDVLQILKEEQADQVGGVMHCFVEDLDTALRAIDLNFRISFSGIVTFKNAKELKEVAKQVPDSSLLIETDSPYLAPMPYRGKQNQPAYVRYVAEHLAQLRQVSLEQIASITTTNYRMLFG
ncbi:MAG: TatD family hydrolase, partial [Gammaproteobacteria bacterium]